MGTWASNVHITTFIISLKTTKAYRRQICMPSNLKKQAEQNAVLTIKHGTLHDELNKNIWSRGRGGGVRGIMCRTTVGHMYKVVGRVGQRGETGIPSPWTQTLHHAE